MVNRIVGHSLCHGCCERARFIRRRRGMVSLWVPMAANVLFVNGLIQAAACVGHGLAPFRFLAG